MSLASLKEESIFEFWQFISELASLANNSETIFIYKYCSLRSQMNLKRFLFQQILLASLAYFGLLHFLTIYFRACFAHKWFWNNFYFYGHCSLCSLILVFDLITRIRCIRYYSLIYKYLGWLIPRYLVYSYMYATD